VVIGPIDDALAQCAMVLGDHRAAEQYASFAVQASRARGTPIFLGRELLLLAAARVEHGVTSGQVEPLVTEALQIAAATGAHVTEHDARRYGFT
jgi:hypothetical protein